MLDWNRRVEIAQAAVDKFCGQPFAWGKTDCVRLAAFVMREADEPVSLVKAGSYSTERGALRALARTGFDSLPDAVDAEGLVRIPPAAAWPGDLLLLPTDEPGPWGGALAIRLTNNRALGFLNGVCAVIQPSEYIIAWRLG